MQKIQGIEVDSGTREELLPGYRAEFPYIASCAELDKYKTPFIPWHWHRPVELFYMESGALEYETPAGKQIFPAGTGGMVNSNVLHRTRVLSGEEPNVQLLHIFDPALLSGVPGGRIERSYFTPILTDPSLELLPLSPEKPEEAALLRELRAAFFLPDREPGFELELQRALLGLWKRLYLLVQPRLQGKPGQPVNTEAVKAMLLYIRTHYSQSISVKELAKASLLSERECYRVFRACLHSSPTEYLIQFRLQEACRLLRESRASVTEIAHACGFGSSSYFGKLFLRQLGCTPRQYRQHWQDSNKKEQN